MEDRLRKFATLIDSGSFTKAAEALHLSQPALTIAIKKLERELKSELLVRLGHGFRLTQAGQIAYAEGQNLTLRQQNLRLQLAGLSGKKISLNIGLIDGMAAVLFTAKKPFEALEEIAQVSLSVNNSVTLIGDVAQGQLDIAVVVKQPQKLPGTLQIRSLGVEPLIFVTHASRVEGVEESLSSHHLPDFLNYNSRSTTSQLIMASAERANIVLQEVFNSTNPEIILEMILNKRGVAALPQLLVEPHIASGELVPIFLGNLCIVRREIIAVKRSGRMLAPVVDTTLSQISKVLTGLMLEASSYKSQKQ